MRIRWRNFELPSQVRLDNDTATDRYGRFVVEPFERGFGTTIGNGLRRVLLSSIEGTAVTSVKIDGVVHEFSTIPGVLEDVTQIILNLKKLRVRMHTDAPCMLTLEANQKGEVLASMIETDHNVDIVSQDLKICTLTDNVPFKAEIQVRKGRGYVTAEDNATDDMEARRDPARLDLQPDLPREVLDREHARRQVHQLRPSGPRDLERRHGRPGDGAR
jgi:DNA-directed RNA polymerase subunit alpha